MEKFWKITAITAVMIIVLAIGASFVLAQTDNSADPPAVEESTPDEQTLPFQGKFAHGGRDHLGPMMGSRYDDEGSALDLLSEELDMTTEEIAAELQTGISVAELAENHGLDIDVIIDALVEQARERITERLNTPWSEARSSRSHPMLDDIAEALGMTSDEVLAELETGISLAELAENHGVDVQVVIDAWMADMQTRMDEAVETGRLTQEQADEMLSHMEEQITERINEPWDADQHLGPMDGHGMGQGGHHGGMRGGFNNWNQPDDAPEAEGTNL